jgi:prepilin-type N-terminal cleavage/methylation domain-containing protein
MSCHRCPTRRGFTLVELLSVVTIVAVLAGLVLPAVAGLRTKATAAKCVLQMKTFALALQMYAGDNQDFIPPNRMGVGIPRNQTWVGGWVTGRSPDGTNTTFLRDSLLSRYITDLSDWRCPGDRSRIYLEGKYYNRVRSISMNYYMGANWTTPNRMTYRKLSDINHPSPSDAFVFTDERPETINDGAFVVDANFNAHHPIDWHLIDLPGNFHGNGTGMAFADGRGEMHIWSDQRTAAASHPFQVMSSNQDLNWLDLHSSAPPENH